MNYAVIDTETNYFNQLMSIGVVITDSNLYELDRLYYVITPAYLRPSMFEASLDLNNAKMENIKTRFDAIDEIIKILKSYNVEKIFAYNAKFDISYLEELKIFRWYDIMRIAAYQEFNKAITNDMDLCKNGRLKRGYGVENIYRMLSKDYCYSETHNALLDAIDELEIMRMLNVSIDSYIEL